MRAELLFQNRAFRLAFSPLLAPAALLYGLGVALDRSRKSARQRCLPAPVISIGNVTVGGTGKTPVLLHLLSELKALGLRAAVLTRGYNGAGMGRREGCVTGVAEAAEFSDEVRLVAEKFPDVVIGVGADRSEMATAVLKRGVVDLFILDDGFQHWSLARNLDVVCVDASRPLERFLLPLGLLREPLGSLRRAGLVLLTRCELASDASLQKLEADIRKRSPDAVILRSRFELTLDAPAAGAAIAMSAIGNPASFEAALTKMGFDVHPARFPDHHTYGEPDLEKVAASARSLGATVIVTEKDWVKLKKTRWGQEKDRPSLRVAAQKLVFVGEGARAWTGRIEQTDRMGS